MIHCSTLHHAPLWTPRRAAYTQPSATSTIQDTGHLYTPLSPPHRLQWMILASRQPALPLSHYPSPFYHTQSITTTTSEDPLRLQDQVRKLDPLHTQNRHLLTQILSSLGALRHAHASFTKTLADLLPLRSEYCPVVSPTIIRVVNAERLIATIEVLGRPRTLPTAEVRDRNWMYFVLNLAREGGGGLLGEGRGSGGE